MLTLHLLSSQGHWRVLHIQRIHDPISPVCSVSRMDLDPPMRCQTLKLSTYIPSFPVCRSGNALS